MNIIINGKEHTIIFVKKKVKRTFIKINHKKEIIITSPKALKEEGLIEIVNLNLTWISNQLSKIKDIKLNENEYLVYGRKYSLVLNNLITNDYEIINDTIYHKANGLEKLALKQEQIIIEKFNEILPSYGFDFNPRIIVKFMKSKWGVCHYKKNKVVINKVFIHLPIRLLEYVIHHELTHFIIPNHSKDFYKVLHLRLENHKILQKELKQYSYLLIK